MATVYDATVEVLTEIVGPVPAQLCMHSAAVELGKGSEALTVSDFDAIASKIRKDMARFASPVLIEDALARIRAKLG
jgi:hypothetical protein